MESSLWLNTADLPQFGSMQGDMKTDVLIVGGGMAGVLTAYLLEQAGVDYALVEAARICHGVTCGTTAKITAQHGLIYQDLVKKFGTEHAGMYLDANQNALGRYRELCAGMDCGFEEKDAFVYSVDDRRKIERELAVLWEIGYPAEFAECDSLPFETSGAVCFRDQAQFHPLKFLRGIAQGLNIYENTKVQEMLGRDVRTDKGRIRAEKVIVATHFPFLNKYGAYFMKMHQHRSYVLAAEDAAEVGGMFVDADHYGFSFRNSGKYLLIGGGAHRTGKQGACWAAAEDLLRQYYPQAKIAYRWAAQDCMTLDGMPYIGRYARTTPNIYVATGFNKWGMTSSMVAAEILRDCVLGRRNDYAELFSPKRSVMHLQLAGNIASAAAGLLSVSEKRCPHLGCALKWNPQEHSWDCPCHGSRFTEPGELINGPATDDLK